MAWADKGEGMNGNEKVWQWLIKVNANSTANNVMATKNDDARGKG